MSKDFCHACRSSPAETEITLETEKESLPYQLCWACAHRLDKYSLRPVEWFNLAAIHGPWRYHLHDDFYDEDGHAGQPEEPVENPDQFPIPQLSEIRHDVERLVDMAMTRWFYSHHDTPQLASAVDELEASALLACLKRRIASPCDPSIESSAYRIAAVNLKAFAGEWIVAQEATHHTQSFIAWSYACAACLPFNEGFALVTKLLRSRPQEDPARTLAALAHFCGEPLLDWIEANIYEPITENWGRSAAMAGISWQRATEWINRGRPLSLVALDALNACWNYNTPMLRELQPKLLGRVGREEIIGTLKTYISKDPAPRPTRAAKSAIDHIDQIAKDKFE